MKSLYRHSLIVLILFSTILSAISQDKGALTITDMMKFRRVESPSISDDGKWVVHSEVPDRGDPAVQVYSSDGKSHYTLQRGKNPVISRDGLWVAAVHAIPAEEHIKLKPGEDKGPKAGLLLINTFTGEKSSFENVKSFQFSNDGNWLLYHKYKEQEKKAKLENENEGEKEAVKAEKKAEEMKEENKNAGTLLNLMSLKSGANHAFQFVTHYAMDSIANFLAFAVADTTGDGNGVYVVELSESPHQTMQIYSESSSWADYLIWDSRNGQLAFLAGVLNKKEKRADADLYIWSPGEERSGRKLADKDLPEGWNIYHNNKLSWTKDGQRLFLGIKPASEIVLPEEEKNDSLVDLFDQETILSDRAVDVWHWNDPYINPNQKKRWKQEKDRTYTGVFFPENGKFVPLASTEIPDVRVTESNTTLLGSSSVPYAQRRTWEGQIRDYYLVDISSGEKKLVINEQHHSVNLSPDGRFMVWFRDGDWHLLETSTMKSRNLTEGLEVTFADEDWDYPSDTPDYRVAGWLDGSEAVIIYDKYDIWQFATSGADPVCLTERKGRGEKYQFRIKRFDPEKRCFNSGETIHMTAYHDMKKHTALFSMNAGTPGVTSIVEESKKYTLLAKARDSDKILYSRQSYTEFPDLWVADQNFKKPKKLSDVYPQIKEIAWGDAELVEWSSVDGTPLQGILIRPGNYEPGKKYPVLVYYYRFMSNRLYDFNSVTVNHRPCFPFYASNGYAIFLPDIRFDIGNPGYSATKCLVPGVQKIIDMGVADPEAICLHGHSWSGYQTAFAITQTDIFTCAIAGAPVSNMTSAYSGIRWETGLARQFQYEKTQSRIGGSLWEARDKYIENSPVFFADRINTPLLIMFGDVDGAVPWYQGIEMYLAMRRLGKDCVFLQYRDEPHHPKKYPNKLDYTIKFKEYLDHYLKGEPAAEWIESGIPYRGK